MCLKAKQRIATPSTFHFWLIGKLFGLFFKLLLELCNPPQRTLKSAFMFLYNATLIKLTADSMYTVMDYTTPGGFKNVLTDFFIFLFRC